MEGVNVGGYFRDLHIVDLVEMLLNLLSDQATAKSPADGVFIAVSLAAHPGRKVIAQTFPAFSISRI